MKLSDKLKINDWLSSPNRTASEGKLLYLQFGVNINIIRMLNRINDTRKIISILDTQFKILLGISVLPEQIDIKPIKKQIGIKPKIKQIDTRKKNIDKALAKSIQPKEREKSDPFTKLSSRPEVLIPIYEEKNKLYVEAKNLHSMLVAKGDEMDKFDEESKDYKKLAAERKEMAKQIISLFDQVNKCWKQIDFFAINKKLPEPEILEQKPEIKADDTNPIELDKRWRTLGTYISKAKKNPERNQEKLKELITESNEIAKKLNTILKISKYKMRQYKIPLVKKD